MVDEASGRWAMLNWAKAADSGVSNVRAVALNTNARESFLYATALAGCVFAVLGIQICRDEAQYTVIKRSPFWTGMSTLILSHPLLY